MRVVKNKPKGKTILPRPAISATIFFDPNERKEIEEILKIAPEYNYPNNGNKTVRFNGGVYGIGRIDDLDELIYGRGGTDEEKRDVKKH